MIIFGGTNCNTRSNISLCVARLDTITELEKQRYSYCPILAKGPTRQSDPSSTAYVTCLVSIIAICISANAQQNVFNVQSYGAAGNGITDDSLAFMKAWKDTCGAGTGIPTMIIPKGKIFLVNPITFTGPCKPSIINVKLSGTIVAPNGPDQWKAADLSTWLAFQDVNGLTIDGPGTMDGSGKGWWDRSCKLHPGHQGCIRLAPTVLKFARCNNIHMSNIKFQNSPQTHVLVLGCQDVDFGFLTVQAPGTSPNTDGIHIQISRNVSIYNSQIGDGDDCISIGDLTSDINITNINCGPGHGVSIGSLGKDGGEAQVKNINVRGVNFRGTTNGVRIKTWQTGRGVVESVSFSNINFTAVKNPIIIDQFYCDVPNSCRETNTGVHINGVLYSQLYGTSRTQVAINLNCSDNFPCTGITLENIQLASATRGGHLVSNCNNAIGVSRGIVEPKSCLPNII
ncbi:hypothetical protein SCA6_018958 [Theobroma cacao]